MPRMRKISHTILDLPRCVCEKIRMPKPPPELSKRERQIMDIIYARGQVTAAEVESALADPPSYSTVRTLLGILERKGFLKHRQGGRRYVSLPPEPHQKASRHAI